LIANEQHRASNAFCEVVAGHRSPRTTLAEASQSRNSAKHPGLREALNQATTRGSGVAKQPDGIRERITMRLSSSTASALLSGWLLIVAPLLAPAQPAPPIAAPVALVWDASPDASVTGCALYYAIVDSGVTNRLDVGMVLTASVSNLLAGSNYLFFVVAYNSSGIESDPSNVLLYSPPLPVLPPVHNRQPHGKTPR
jgi:hypothetical protein